MPILPAETASHPESILRELPCQNPERRWWAAHTRTRQEKALSRQLVGREVPFYLPLIMQRTRSRLPLFPGYLFVYGCREECAEALTTNRVVTILPVMDQARFYRDLQQIGRLIDSNAPLTIESRLSPGRKVRVRRGSLKGLEGVVMERRGGSRLLVAVNFLQQGVSLSVEDFALEPV